MYGDGERDELISLWHTCFGDEESGIAFFFDYFGPDARTLTARADGRTVSMLHLLPARACLKDGWRPAYYIYAVGTLPAYRGRGCGGALVRRAAREAGREGRPVFLVPEREELFRFYENLGFVPCAREKTLSGRAGTDAAPPCRGTESPLLRGLEPERYLKLRESAFAGTGCLRLAEKGTFYAMRLWLEEGGRCALLREGGRDWGLLYRMSGKEARFLEITAADPARAAAVAARAAGLLGAETYALCRGRNVCAAGPGISEIEDGYFNLAMD